MFKTLEREETLASRVSREIERLIVVGRFHLGGRLPAERQLADEFGVSRTVVREAVRSLMAKGLVEVRHGSGMMIRTPSAETVSQSMALFLRGGQPELDYKKVMEVRRLLEVEIAGLAAERRTTEDLAAMQVILDDTEGIRQKRARFVEWDVAFHAALATATHNEMFSLLLDSVVGTMKQVRELGFDVPSSPSNAIKHHQAIFIRVAARDEGGARQAMRDHLAEAEQTMRRALELRKKAESKGGGLRG